MMHFLRGQETFEGANIPVHELSVAKHRWPEDFPRVRLCKAGQIADLEGLKVAIP